MRTIHFFLFTGLIAICSNLNAQIKVDANGKVGIGEDSPSTKLHINGDVRGAASGGALRINTGNGYIDIGPMNTSYAHIYTDRAQFIFNKDLYTMGGVSSYGSGNLYLKNNGNTRMTILSSNGNVGVGTTSPSYKLHVSGDIYANGGWVRVSGASGLYFQSYGGGFRMEDATWIRTYGNKSFYHNTGTMRTDGTFQVGPSGNRFLVNTSGNVGIGQTSPSCKLDVEGVIKSNGVVVTSDERFKENIKDLNTPVSSIKRLRPVEYTMKKMEETAIELSQEERLLEESLHLEANSPMDSLSLAMLPKEKPKGQEKEKMPNLEDDYYERNRIGFLAQDMEQVFPELVYTDKNGYKSIDYTSLIPVLVKGMQEQQAIIEQQQAQIDELKNMLNTNGD